MAEVLLLEQQSFTTAYLAEAGCFLMDVAVPDDFGLTAGQEYQIRLDGTDYTCVCFDASAVLADAVGLGNGVPLGLSGNGEPFAVSWIMGQTEITVYCFTDVAPTEHTITIQGPAYTQTEPEEPEEPKVLLLDHTGTQQEYARPGRIRVNTSDGGTTDFIHESLVAEPVETTVELDFSGGDMEITPGNGQAFFKVTVPVPENLESGNIAEGVSIAGVVGEMMSGGKDVKIAVGSFTGNGGSVTVYHNLGVVPDVFVAYCTGAYTLSGERSISSPVAIGVSRAFKDRYGVEISRYGLMPYSNTSVVTEKTTLYGTDDNGNTRWIYSATAEKITIGSSYVKTFSQKYEWIAIGGLV